MARLNARLNGEVVQLRRQLPLSEGEQPPCRLCRRRDQQRRDLRAERGVDLLEAAQRIERVEAFAFICPKVPRQEPRQVAHGVDRKKS